MKLIPKRSPSEVVNSRFGTSIPDQPSGFKTPTNYLELCELSDSALYLCDIALMNLLCAEGLRGSENLNVKDCLEKLDGIAKYVKGDTERNFHKFKEKPGDYNNSEGYFRIMMMVTVLQQDLGVHYNPDRRQIPGTPIQPNQQFFANSQDVFIHGLALKNGTGTCSSMPVFYVAVGRRLGYPLKLVKAKGHLFVRWEEGERSFNVESTSIGFISFQDDYYRTWPAPFTPEEEQSERYLKAMTPAQELAVFLSIRGMCLAAAGQRMWSLVAFVHAIRKEPESVGHQLIYQRAEKEALQAGALTPQQANVLAVQRLPIPDGPMRQYYFQRREVLKAQIMSGVPEDDLEMEFRILRAELLSHARRESLKKERNSAGKSSPAMINSPPR